MNRIKNDERRTTVDDAADAHVPRKMTFAQNAILTLQVLAGFALLGAGLWIVNLWTSAK